MTGVALFLVILMLPVCASAQSDSARVTFIHFQQAPHTAIVFKNRENLAELPRRSFFTVTLAPGKYVFAAENYNRDSVMVTLNASDEKIYAIVFKPGFFGATASLKEISKGASTVLYDTNELKELKQADALPKRLVNRFGFQLGGGIGSESEAVLETDKGDDIDFSFGGGFFAGVSAGTEVSDRFDLSTELMYKQSTLSEDVKNADIEFSRVHWSIRPSVIIPIVGGRKQRLKIGPGMDYYFGGTMKWKTRKVPGGFDETWKYGSTMGYHAAFVYENNALKDGTISIGVKYTGARFRYKESRNNYYYPTDDFFARPNSSGVDFFMTYSVVF
jgi:hypothetical protein